MKKIQFFEKIKAKPLTNLIILLIIAFILQYNIFIFSNEIKNKIFELSCSIVFPILFILNSFNFKKTFLRSISFSISAVITVFCFFTIFFISTRFPSRECIARINMKDYDVTIFRDIAGVFSEPDITIRQERKILPGILLVHTIFQEYSMKYVDVDLSYKILDENTILLDIDGEKSEHKFKKFVYW